MEMYYKEFQDIIKQLSDELDEFNSLYNKRIKIGCLLGKEEPRYQSLIYSIPNLLNKIQNVDKIRFHEKSYFER